ncbi:phosphatase PAP2 family protein [Psychroflexus aestuariivivens]|uniref:phosphatase PAP2 family protein n=1 Tax=Psychroflexus aestuariivivens TaxID=1795040 RepID=UPI000FD94635|nr:phosphatase PAP2 family protein [Psychroflexus aestuariivivens]
MQLNPAKWDIELMIFLNNLSPNSLDSFWVFVTHSKNWIPFYIFLLVLFFIKTSWKSGLFGSSLLLINVGFIHFITELTKFYVQRLRPNFAEEISTSLKILYEPQNFSFFSGHASTSFGATVFIYLCLKSRFKHLGWIFIWPILFSLSRIFVGVHYPSDIIVGAFVGTILAIIMSKVYFKFQPKFNSNR